jgi:hypothetical protein
MQQQNTLKLSLTNIAANIFKVSKTRTQDKNIKK